MHLAYERIFGAGARASLGGFSFSLVLSLLLLITSTGGFLAGDIPLIIPLFIAAFWALGLYTLAMTYFTRTQILYDGHLLHISRHSLPHPLQEKDINISIDAIEHIYIEETYSSKRRAYPTRTFHIYADTYSGERILLLKDMPEHYALYIQQEIQKQIHANHENTASRLTEQYQSDDMVIVDDDISRSPIYETKR